MKRVALLLFLLVVGLVAALWLLRGHGRLKRAAAPTAPAATQPAPSAKQPSAAAGAPAQPHLAYDDDPAGSLRLEGQVIDADEQPVAGARVHLDSHPDRDTDTGGDGSFVFAKLISREYSLEAHRDDLAAGPVKVHLTATSEPVILRMKPAGAVEVTVIAEAGRRPVAGAKVSLGNLGDRETDAGGIVLFRGVQAGWHNARVTAEGLAPAEKLFETSGKPGLTDKQTIELATGAPASGVVLSEHGAPRAGARVLARPVSALFALSDEGAATTDAQGRWRLAALPAGTFRFTATHEAYPKGASPPMALDGKTEQRGIQIQLEAAARLEGRVVTRAGAGVPGAAVRVALVDAGMSDEATRQAFTDEQGRFTLPGLPRKPVHVIAIHESASSSVVAFDLAARPDTTDATLTLDVDGAIAGVVVTPDGQPVAEAQVMAVADLSGAKDELSELRLRGLATDFTDAGGRFRLHGLGSGTYRVRATRAGSGWERLWAQPGLAAQVGATDVRVVLPADGRVRGKVLFADGTAPATYAVGVDVSPPQPFADASGAFALTDVPAGQRRLTVMGPSFIKKAVDAVDVKPDAEIDVGTVTVEKGRSVSGRVLRHDGSPVAGAKVLCGAKLMSMGSELGSSLFTSRLGIKEATSADDGTFLLAGVGAIDLLVAADHADGRSALVPLAAGTESVQVDLILLASGALEGKITQAGKPVQAAVMAAPKAAQRGRFLVTTGADGTYRFDKLAPEEYLVSAILQGGVGGAQLETGRTAVAPGQTAHLDIDIPRGGTTISVRITKEGVPAPSAVVFLGHGSFTAKTASELESAYGEGSARQGMVMKGAPLTIENVTAGPYTACAVPLPGDPNDMAAMQGLEAEKLPVTCRPVTVGSAPTLDVVIALPK